MTVRDLFRASLCYAVVGLAWGLFVYALARSQP